MFRSQELCGFLKYAAGKPGFAALHEGEQQMERAESNQDCELVTKLLIDLI